MFCGFIYNLNNGGGVSRITGYRYFTYFSTESYWMVWSILKNVTVFTYTIKIKMHRVILNCYDIINRNSEHSCKYRFSIVWSDFKCSNWLNNIPIRASNIWRQRVFPKIFSQTYLNFSSWCVPNILQLWQKFPCNNSIGTFIYNYANFYLLQIYKSPLSALHTFSENRPLTIRKICVYSSNEQNSRHYKNINTFIAQVPNIIGLLCLGLAYYFFVRSGFAFVIHYQIAFAIIYLMLGFGLVWIGLFHILFGFWYLN